jgi:uncharacterized damage-inducible protein DinB
VSAAPSFEALLAHRSWALLRLAAALAERPGEPSERIRRLVAHHTAAERIWLDRIAGAPASVEVWPPDSVAEALSAAATTEQELAKVVASGGVERVVEYRNSRGEAFASRVADILTHVFLHGTHHRAQISMALRDEGAVPPNIDFIAFVRE